MVCEAIKTAIYAQCLLELVGKKPIPRYCEDHNDIVTCFDADTADASSASAAAFRPPAPWTAMPHRNPLRSRAIPMRSSCKRQLYPGSTIELSCDGPLREPYTCYLQGGLNFAASRAGVLLAVQNAYFKN